MERTQSTRLPVVTAAVHRRPSDVETGDTYNHWTVVGNGYLSTHTATPLLYFPCRCVCGTTRDVAARSLVENKSRSCGCEHIKNVRAASTKHGLCPRAHTSERDKRITCIWRGMKQRTLNPNARGFKNYGGRGIGLCDAWHDLATFHKWATCNGYRHDLTLDRVDHNGPYHPDNCRWASVEQQNRNTRRNLKISAFGETKCASEWECDARCAVVASTLCYRIKEGWGAARAITTPSMRYAGAKPSHERA